MSKPKTVSSQVARNWDAYWRGTGEIEAFSSGGVSHPAIRAFWDNFFRSAKQDYRKPSLLDIASGNGSVVERALSVFPPGDIDICCVDISESAVENIQKRFSGVRSLVADARSISLEPESFDLVSSQFGVEYAGLEAIDEAVRMLAEEGLLAMLLHNQAGAIYRECRDNLDAVSQLRETDFVRLSAEMFRAGFKAVRGEDRAHYDQAARLLAPAIAAVEEIMQRYGQGVADDTVARLYSDVGEIHTAIQHYDPDEVLDWLGRMDGELETYAGRMTSMCEAAMDESTFQKICFGLAKMNCQVIQSGPLVVPGNDLPLAWVLTAKKSR